MYEIHNLMYFYHRIYPASGPSRKGNEPISRMGGACSMFHVVLLLYRQRRLDL